MTYSESFYYAVISSIIYFTISTLLLFNVIGASRFFRAYPPTFAALTLPQRTLMLQTILFSLYLALGAGVFSAAEGWTFTDGLYWADYTVLTIGLGTDFPLKTTVGRMLLLPYAPFGIIMVGLLVRSVMALVMERAKEKVVMRHLGRERDRWTDSINKRLQGKDENLRDPQPQSLLFCWHYRRHKKFQQLPRVIAHARSTQQQDQHHDGKWHHAEFELMRYIQVSSEQSERYFALIVSTFAFLVVWIGGSLVFWATEHVSRVSHFWLATCAPLITGIIETPAVDIHRIPLLHIHYPPHDRIWRFLSNVSSRKALFRYLEFDSSANNDSLDWEYGRYSRRRRAGNDRLDREKDTGVARISK